MSEKIWYLYNNESHEIFIAIGDEEFQRKRSQRSGWIEIDKDTFYMINDAIASAYARFKEKINRLYSEL